MGAFEGEQSILLCCISGKRVFSICSSFFFGEMVIQNKIGNIDSSGMSLVNQRQGVGLKI